MSDNNTFKRIEKKYLLDKDKYIQLIDRLNPYIQLDEYGLHTICNVYFDTENFDLIRRSIDKPVYKEKLRLRSYGVPKKDSQVFLEIKKKYRGVVYKRRVSLTLEEAESYLSNKCELSEGQIEKEIDYFVKFYKPIPKIYIAYDRMAYFGKKESNLRITFDENIRSREDFLELKYGDAGKLLLDKGNKLMEIKVSGAIPFEISRVLSELEIFPVSFSKYGNVYKNKLYSAKLNTDCTIEDKIDYIFDGNIA